ncbi:MAG TPA: serine/threonine-protein kinase [Solirubrobacterales bacterium]|nr:serine/threonine-protein kinase [Solirubrobacterales bacterium]
MQIARGMVIAGFRLEEMIGEGGMGVVWKTRQLELDRVVAVKLIQPDKSGDADFLNRFQRESRLAASIDHPNVVPVFGAGEEDGVWYIAMRYVDGTDLGEYLRSRNSPLPPTDAAKLISKVADGLDAAHAAGLVHRDVKPANILLDAHLHPYLTDFGLTKQIASQSNATRTGVWVGSVNYAAPEQIESGPIDARTDVYSLGCVLFETLTKRLPYARDSEMAVMYAKVHEPPLLPGQIDPTLPREFDEVIRRALARDPEDRYPSAGDFGRAAIAAAHGERATGPERTVARGAAAGAGGYEPTQATPVPKHPTQVMRTHRSRNRAAVVAAILTGLGIVAVAAILISSSGSSDSGPSKAEASVGKKQRTTKEPEAKASASEVPAREEEVRPGTSSRAAKVASLEPFQGNLYSADVPVGWTAEEVETRPSAYYESHWRNPDDENTSVLIDSQVHDEATDAVEDAEGVREETAQSVGYRELAFEETTLQGQQAVRWVFEVEEDRRVDYFVISCGIGFGVLGSTSPSTFGHWAPTFYAVANSVTGHCA